ncbi:hypothetical protein H8356DRAFT_1352120 [Neocallimastix lanati (nom. inval.)]|nr:hypothetical protein H8356DRAFT_1352120 [Neocallimastix sp. JGI-2020a]
MGVYLTVIPKLQYRSTLRDPQGKAEPTTGAGNYNPLRQGLSNGILEYLGWRKNREDLILIKVDPNPENNIHNIITISNILIINNRKINLKHNY